MLLIGPLDHYMYTYIPYINTYIITCIHTCHTYNKCIHVHILTWHTYNDTCHTYNKCIHVHIITCHHKYISTCIHYVYTSNHMHGYIHTYTHIKSHACIHTHPHTSHHMRAYIHTHMHYSCALSCLVLKKVKYSAWILTTKFCLCDSEECFR